MMSSSREASECLALGAAVGDDVQVRREALPSALRTTDRGGGPLT